MHREQLGAIVGELNEERERRIHQQATGLIIEITKQQSKIKTAQDTIAECQKELRELEVEQLNSAEVLGGEA